MMVGAIDERLERIADNERWQAGEVIFREGEPARGIYIVYSGSIDLVFSARSGLKKTLRTVLPGDVLGLSEVVSKVPHDCTATTRSGAKIGFVPIELLQRELETTPALWFSIARYLSADVDSCWASMRTLAVSR